MKIFVILENAGGELGREEINARRTDDDAISEAISNVIEYWTLSVGDTIRIVEATD